MFKRVCFISCILIIVSSALTGCGGKAEDKGPSAAGPKEEAAEINISAAASLTDPLTEIQAEYAKKSNALLRFNFGASGALQVQIEEGAPCDLFISASKANMDALEQAGLVAADSRKDILGNTLTLVAAAEKAGAVKGKGYEILTSSDVARISVGDPQTVPAGKYAQQALESLGVWEQIQDKIILAKDVKQVLSYVDTGNVDCGLVYRSDAMAMKTGFIVMDIPDESHEPIVYPAALIKASKQPDEAAKFYDFLQTDYAKGVFEKYGFKVFP